VADRELSLELRLIKPGDRVAGFSCGDAAALPLKTFLQKQAVGYQKQNLARTYAVFDGDNGNRIAAYVTLVCGEIVLESDGVRPAHEDGITYRFSHYPAVKIARLAVDSRYRGRGLGATLVDFSLGVAKDTVSSAVGCRFLVVDSKKSAVDFYMKRGFTLIDTDENRRRDEPILFVDLMKL